MLAFMLPVDNLANTKLCKKLKNMTETLAYGYSSEMSYQRLISLWSYPMNTNMTGFRGFSKIVGGVKCASEGQVLDQ